MIYCNRFSLQETFVLWKKHVKDVKVQNLEHFHIRWAPTQNHTPLLLDHYALSTRSSLTYFLCDTTTLETNRTMPTVQLIPENLHTNNQHWVQRTILKNQLLIVSGGQIKHIQELQNFATKTLPTKQICLLCWMLLHCNFKSSNPPTSPTQRTPLPSSLQYSSQPMKVYRV